VCLLAVVNELEGLARGGKAPGVTSTSSAEAARHVQHVAECASSALSFLKGRQAGVRCVTTRGTVLASTTCTLEEDSSEQVSYPFSLMLVLINVYMQ
jgi:protein SMG6